LLGFQNKAAALVKVYPAIAAAAIGFPMRDTAFIAVIAAGTRSWVWLRHFNDGAKLIKEAGVIGAFRLRGAGPTGVEGFNFR
jgi:hypothetical protein